jgi:predicted ATPase
MKIPFNGLAKEVSNLYQDNSRRIDNELRYKIGEKLNDFYISNKENIKQSSEEIDEALKSFAIEHMVKFERLFKKSNVKHSNWDKIKIAFSEWLMLMSGEKGFGITNLNYMLQFYRKYRNYPDFLRIAHKLSWSQNVVLLKDKLNDDERKYYLKRANKEKWTINELNNRIEEETYDDFLKLLTETNSNFIIENVKIRNYKSLVEINISKPSRLLVFAGANATGKSSIFEAIDLLIHAAMTHGSIALDIFGGPDKLVNYTLQKNQDDILQIMLELSFKDSKKEEVIEFGLTYDIRTGDFQKEFSGSSLMDNRIIDSFSRIFIDNYKKAQSKIKVYNKLWLDAGNLNTIIKNVLKDQTKNEEIVDWIRLLVPGTLNVLIDKDLSGKEELLVFEEAYPDRPFVGDLISEGTYKIIALLTLIYQSDQPQFICIEEPEIGLNPAIIKELVSFFREVTNKYNHHIWISTHSTSLVTELVEEELAIVNKKGGITKIYQCQNGDFEGMPPDEAWMSNMLKGGGLPW